MVPTRHCMRVGPATSSDDATAAHGVGEGARNGWAACPQAEGSRRIACESRIIHLRRSARPATSTQRIGPSRTGLCSTGTGAGGGKSRRTALTRRARSPLTAFRQALFPKSTRLTIRLVGQVDGPLGKGIFLTHFTQPQVSSRRTAQFSILLQDEVLCPEASRGSSGWTGHRGSHGAGTRRRARTGRAVAQDSGARSRVHRVCGRANEFLAAPGRG